MKLFLSSLLLLVSVLAEPGCCPVRLSIPDAYSQSPVVFTARVHAVTCYSDLSCVYSLDIRTVYKGRLPTSSAPLTGNLPCGRMTADHILPAQNTIGVFFGVGSSQSTIVNLLPCAPHGLLTPCVQEGLSTGSFKNCVDSNSTTLNPTPPITPKPTTPNMECDCADDRTWNSGCSTCKCKDNGDGTCRVSCKTNRSCVMIPSMIATGMFIMFLGCCLFALRRWRKRMESTSTDVELVDIQSTHEYVNPAINSHASVNYGMPSMMSTGGQSPSSVIMTTPQGQTVMTQPMYMVTQTGEPVVVQVAYV